MSAACKMCGKLTHENPSQVAYCKKRLDALHDHFAGLALLGLVMRGQDVGLAKDAYEIADSMLHLRHQRRVAS